MGQKTNPNIFRLGKVKEWKSKYIERKTSESSIVIFRDLEIKKFIFLFFEKHDLKIQNYHIYYSESSLHIAISYYNAFNSLLIKKKFKARYKKLHSLLFQNKILNIRKAIARQQLYTPKAYKKTILKSTRVKLFQNRYFLSQKSQRLKTLKNLKFYIDKKTYQTIDKHQTNLFVSKFLKTLNFFTHKQHNIFLTLKQINNETTFLNLFSKKEKRKSKTKLAEFRRFQQNEFFKKGFNFLHNFVTNSYSALFLAKFIAVYLKKLKRPNFFLRFLKTSLETLIIRRSSKFTQVQVKIQGRFNGAPRSKRKFLNIGNQIPILMLKSNIDYGKATAYTSNGTFGIKVWTCATNNKKLLC